MTHRLLLVEQSATMRYVLEKHAESLGYVVDACPDYSQAADTLSQQFQEFGAELAGVVFGWPTTSQEDASAFARLLETREHKDLPVVVMSTDMRAETRAWAAARGQTEVLAWKEYQRLDELLKQLIDAAPADDLHGNPLEQKRDNSDVHLLVVDDSATIRYSLRDLFHKQGYRVTLAATRDEAIAKATSTTFDIAILDYYLVETTGDLLCRELLASADTGDIVCTVLTGTYSDHIIKRSLRAGAVECMFKNESSELLLSRIEALSRFVRQRRQLLSEQELLEHILDSIAGPVVMVNRENHIVYSNTLASEALGLEDRFVLTGQPGEALLEEGGPQAAGDTVHAATWRVSEDNTVDVDYQHTLVNASGDISGYSLLRFARRSMPITNTKLVLLPQDGDADMLAQNAIRQFSLHDECKPFLRQMLTYLCRAKQERSASAAEVKKASSMQVSLLVLDVFPTHEAQAVQVRAALHALVTREGHVAVLSENRYGFLLRHAETSQAYVLTRKVMQHCLRSVPEHKDKQRKKDSQKDQDHDNGGVNGASLVCRGSLLNLTNNAAQPMNVLIEHSFRGMDLINAREPNQALLLDVRRLLSAFPAAE